MKSSGWRGLDCSTLIGCRELLKLVVSMTGDLAIAQLLLESDAAAAPASSSQGAQAEDVYTETVHYQSDVFKLQAYLAKPKGEGKHPGVILIHDNRGLNDNFKAFAQRFAAEGFVAMAPDLLSRAWLIQRI